MMKTRFPALNRDFMITAYSSMTFASERSGDGFLAWKAG